MSSGIRAAYPRPSGKKRADLLRGAIADVRRQLERLHAKGGDETAWRTRNPGLAALIDHAEGESR